MMTDFRPFPVSLFVAALPVYREREYPTPTSLEIAENKQNIVTGHLEHERTLKKQQLDGTRQWHERRGKLQYGVSKQTLQG